MSSVPSTTGSARPRDEAPGPNERRRRPDQGGPRAILGRLLRTTPGARGRLALAIMLAAGASGASIGLLATSGWLIARAAEMPPIMYLNVAIVGVRFFGLARSVLRYAERLVGHQLALRMQSQLRVETYSTLARTTLLGKRRGDLLTRVVADVDAILDLVTRVALPFASGAVVSFGAALILLRFSPLNAAVLLGSAILAGAVVPWLAAQLSRNADRATAPARGRLADVAHELNHAAVDLVAYDAADSARARLLDADAELRRAEQRAAWVRGLATALQILCSGMAVLAALVLGTQAARAGNIPARMIAVLALVPLALHEQIADLAQAAQTLTRTRSSLERVDELLRTPAVGTGDAPQDPPVDSASVAIDDVSIGWPGARPLLTGLTLHAGAGERVAVTGPSGSGKTTLAATIMGAIPAPAGSIRVDGRVGYLAQDAHIFATSVAENVRIGRLDASDDDIAAALARAGLAGMDLDRLVGEGGQSLSGGEARRVALARLLVGSADVWLLDEPTEHLDTVTATQLMRDVWAAAGDHPVVVLTHDPDVVAACTREVALAKTARLST